MKRIYKILTSIFLISILVTVGIATSVKQGTEKEHPLPVIDVVPTNIEPAVAEQSTYTDIWTGTATNTMKLTGNVNTQISSQQVNLKFPSTMTVQFSSETRNNKVCYGDCYIPTTAIWATIDGVVISPGGVIFSGQEEWQTNSFTFAKSYVPAGSHTIKIYGYGENGDISFRSTTITANGYGH